jgi:hypothetical protein
MELDKMANNDEHDNFLVQKLLICLETLLKLPEDIALAKHHTDQLVAIFAKLTGVDARAQMLTQDDCYTDSGVAISPVQAAKCLQEPLRSQVFLKAVKQAIIDRQETPSTGPITILYAGTGPYGLLVLPLLALMKTLPVQVCLIDIHQQNVDSVTLLIKALGITDKIVSIDCIDACQWVPKSIKCFDIVVSETMTHMLQREPQVFIFAHLEQYLKPEGTLLPQEISLSATLVDHDKEVALGEFFSLNRITAKQLRANNIQAYQGKIVVPDQDNLPTRLRLDTTLIVYKNYKLARSQTSLAIPIYKDKLYFAQCRIISFHYVFSDNPHFVFDIPQYTPDMNLADFTDIGQLGLLHLKRFWHKIQLDKVKQLDSIIQQKEFAVDFTLVSGCEGQLQQWLAYVYQQHPPCFDDFESWVQAHHNLQTVDTKQLNQAIQKFAAC